MGGFYGTVVRRVSVFLSFFYDVSVACCGTSDAAVLGNGYVRVWGTLYARMGVRYTHLKSFGPGPVFLRTVLRRFLVPGMLKCVVLVPVPLVLPT